MKFNNKHKDIINLLKEHVKNIIRHMADTHQVFIDADNKVSTDDMTDFMSGKENVQKIFDIMESSIENIDKETKLIKNFEDSSFNKVEELAAYFVSYCEAQFLVLANNPPKDLTRTHINLIEIYSNLIKKELYGISERFIEDMKILHIKYIEDYCDPMENMGYIFFDVETLGSYGEPFAYAYEVVNKLGRCVDKGFYYYHPRTALGKNDDRKWIMTNCFPTFDDPKYVDLKVEVRGIHELCDTFREVWKKYNKGFTPVTDCQFPCESNFLFLCNLSPIPMPILDISSLLFAYGRNPVGYYKREPNELPMHNPMADVQQIKRLFFMLAFGEADKIS